MDNKIMHEEEDLNLFTVMFIVSTYTLVIGVVGYLLF